MSDAEDAKRPLGIITMKRGFAFVILLIATQVQTNGAYGQAHADRLLLGFEEAEVNRWMAALNGTRSEAKTKDGVPDLIERLQNANERVVVCSCTSLGEKHHGSNRIDKNLDDFSDVARQVAKKDKKLPLNDLRKVFKDYWKKHNPDNKASGILTHDGNHFTDTGNRFVAEQMLKMFKREASK